MPPPAAAGPSDAGGSGLNRIREYKDAKLRAQTLEQRRAASELAAVRRVNAQKTAPPPAAGSRTDEELAKLLSWLAAEGAQKKRAQDQEARDEAEEQELQALYDQIDADAKLAELMQNEEGWFVTENAQKQRAQDQVARDEAKQRELQALYDQIDADARLAELMQNEENERVAR